MKEIEQIKSSIALLDKCLELGADSNYINVADTYLPIGPNSRDNVIVWEKVYQEIVEKIFELSIQDRGREDVRAEIINSLKNNRETRELAEIINEVYLTSNEIKNITPLAYLICDDIKVNARTKTMTNVVSALLKESVKIKNDRIGNNILETTLISALSELCVKKENDYNKTTYLPFLADAFTNDLKVLSKNPQYFISEIEPIVETYAFLYLTQLTIHACLPFNRYNIPASKPLYFILENETASRERHECGQYGYDYIFSKTKGLAFKLFPTLGYFSRITNDPVWNLSLTTSDEITDEINNFNSKLALLFGGSYHNENSFSKALNAGANIQQQIFDESLPRSKKGSRKSRNKVVVAEFENVFSSGFITNRKAAGKYFVLKSRIIVLLTNLIIIGSESDKLLIDDVIEGFNNRGIYFDMKSKRSLLKFYESVGNVEKLSDSGDAVYVKVTI